MSLPRPHGNHRRQNGRLVIGVNLPSWHDDAHMTFVPSVAADDAALFDDQSDYGY